MFANLAVEDSLYCNSPPPSIAIVICPLFLTVILPNQVSPCYVQICFLSDTGEKSRGGNALVIKVKGRKT